MTEEGFYYDLGETFFWITFSLIIVGPITYLVSRDYYKKQNKKKEKSATELK